mgnify:CR=1 FL=1
MIARRIDSATKKTLSEQSDKTKNNLREHGKTPPRRSLSKYALARKKRGRPLPSSQEPTSQYLKKYQQPLTLLIVPV